MERLKRIIVLILAAIFLTAGAQVEAADTIIVIDSENVYEGMEKSYSEGYIPKVEQGNVFLVVPFLCREELMENHIRVSLNLGDTSNTPFVFKNYIKEVALSEANINGGKETIEAYVAAFKVDLKEERKNGAYPVMLTVEAETVKGEQIKKEQFLYVTISDSPDTDDVQNPDKDPILDNIQTQKPITDDSSMNVPSDLLAGGSAGVSVDTTQLPSFAPKVIVKSCEFSKQPIVAGDEITIKITLFNTSKQSAVKNMTVMISGQGEYFQLKSVTDTVYVDHIPAGTAKEISYQYIVAQATPQAQYSLDLAMDYADEKGGTFNVNGKVNVPVVQETRIQFDAPALSPKMEVADVVNIQIQAANLGRSKVYNVRAELEGDGLMPDGTMFIGDLEPGTSGTGTTRLTVTGLTEGESSYGKTSGKVTFYYEDETGNEYKEVKEVTTEILSPFSKKQEKKPDDTNQWWWLMGGIGAILCVLVVGSIGYRIRQRKQEDEMVE